MDSQIFETGSSANIKLSKTQLSNIVHLAGEDFCDIPIFGSILLNLAK